MTNEASAEAMLVWIMPCKEEFGDSQMMEQREQKPCLYGLCLARRNSATAK